MYPDFLHEAPPTDAYAAFIKESRVEFANARKLNRKSGCTPHGKPGQVGRTWGHPSRTVDLGCQKTATLIFCKLHFAVLWVVGNHN
jgi:hypothetical protein